MDVTQLVKWWLLIPAIGSLTPVIVNVYFLLTVSKKTTIQVNWDLYKKYYLQKKNGKAGQREGYRDQQDLTFATSKCINANFMGLFINYVFLSDENFDAFALKVETPVDVKEVVTWVEGDDYNDEEREDNEGDDNKDDGEWKTLSTGGKLRKSRKSRNTKRYQKSNIYRKKNTIDTILRQIVKER